MLPFTLICLHSFHLQTLLLALCVWHLTLYNKSQLIYLLAPNQEAFVTVQGLLPRASQSSYVLLPCTHKPTRTAGKRSTMSNADLFGSSSTHMLLLPWSFLLPPPVVIQSGMMCTVKSPTLGTSRNWRTRKYINLFKLRWDISNGHVRNQDTLRIVKIW